MSQINSFIAMAHNMDIVIVAEGVEKIEHLS